MHRPHPTRKYDGTEEIATTGSTDGSIVQTETRFVETRLRVDSSWVLYVAGSVPLRGTAGEMPEFDIKPPLLAPLLIFPPGYLLRYFLSEDTSARQRGFEIRVFPLLCQLSKAIEPHLPVCKA